ncbi:hypothetical protein [Capnocytophaga canimorsus]|uniref:Uncharacterized protein n=2 Tax=Capnocytophaga canimorsus TaxID=28188 RepID=F9YTA1_CAPCC|nr:hypothetical protein [Capnocytophaga canimorsus]AEK24020.1 Conserved hypothetical protein [Capnocytophaga canimorsus Cc5]ATA91583.1 hypothetical protein CGC56_05005 [Capnocytophaga canimorsus]WGU68581.1 hypothetical protein QIU19_00720 [Capnocytophaga canimorsus]WGU70312.1 hypothetical protein QIU18_12835 [Capnocytophaga canimorsus]CEN49084.1 conserved hypothetical protein [Capnocytophaga canimorsus]
MEHKEIKFRIICNEKKYLEDILEWYNNTYDTNFEITNMIYDEVNFVDIKSTKFTIEDIFNIGYQFGVEEQRLRQKGEIDW